MVQRSPDALPCSRVREDIDERLSGRLPAGRNAAVEAHLERCHACRAEVELAAAVRRELSALPRFDAPPRVIEAIRRRVGAAPSPASLPFSRNANRRLPARVALAAAAAVALAVAVVVSLPDRSPQPPTSVRRPGRPRDCRGALGIRSRRGRRNHRTGRAAAWSPARPGDGPRASGPLPLRPTGAIVTTPFDDRHTTRTTIPGGSS